MKNTNEQIVERIKQLYTGMQLSASKFAIKIGIIQSTFNRYMIGQNKLSLEAAFTIINALPSLNPE